MTKIIVEIDADLKNAFVLKIAKENQKNLTLKTQKDVVTRLITSYVKGKIK